MVLKRVVGEPLTRECHLESKTETSHPKVEINIHNHVEAIKP